MSEEDQRHSSSTGPDGEDDSPETITAHPPAAQDPARADEPPSGSVRPAGVITILVVIVALALLGIYLFQQPPQEPAATMPPVTSADAPYTETADRADVDGSLTHADGNLTQDAQEYIGDLTTRTDEGIPAADLDGFVAPDQKLLLREGDAGYIEKTVEGMDPSTEVAVIRKQAQVEYRTPRQLQEEHGDSEVLVELLDEDRLVQIPLDELLEHHADTLDLQLAVVVQSEHVEQTTAGALQAAGEQTAKVLKEDFLPKDTTIRSLFGAKISIQKGALFYVRSVAEGDVQGIWGIIHNGLANGFARGIALQRGEDTERYQIDIPLHADERNADSTSSFLGRIIDNKVRESYTFSLRDGRMGQDPDLIIPGREILIVHFSRDELVAIYEHFVKRAHDSGL